MAPDAPGIDTNKPNTSPHSVLALTIRDFNSLETKPFVEPSVPLAGDIASAAVRETYAVPLGGRVVGNVVVGGSSWPACRTAGAPRGIGAAASTIESFKLLPAKLLLAESRIFYIAISAALSEMLPRHALQYTSNLLASTPVIAASIAARDGAPSPSATPMIFQAA